MLVDELTAYGVLSRVVHAVRDAEPALRVYTGTRTEGDPDWACHLYTECAACACAEVRWIPFATEAQCAPSKVIAAR